MFTEEDVDAFARALLPAEGTQDRLYQALEPVKERAESQLDDGRAARLPQSPATTTRASTPSCRRCSRSPIPTSRSCTSSPACCAATSRRRSRSCRRTCRRRSTWTRYASSGPSPGGSQPGARRARTWSRWADAERQAATAEELEPLSRIIQELNERYGAEPRAGGPDHAGPHPRPGRGEGGAPPVGREQHRGERPPRLRDRGHRPAPGPRGHQLQALQAASPTTGTSPST